MVVRSSDPEVQLQGLRTALSLALGDRPARVFLLGPGATVLAADPLSEAGRCIEALREARVALVVHEPASVSVGAPSPALEAILADIAKAPFQQTF